jgi:hypothetical protein
MEYAPSRRNPPSLTVLRLPSIISPEKNRSVAPCVGSAGEADTA